MEYVHNPDLAATAASDVISPLLHQPRFQALIRAFGEAAQLVEDDAHDVALGFNLVAPAPWARVAWGKLLVEEQGALTDDEHMRVIRAKFAAMRSQGTGTSVAQVIKALYPGAPYSVVDLGFASFLVLVVVGYEPSDELKRRTVRLLRLAKAAGVGMMAAYAASADYFGFDEDPGALGFDEGYYFSLFEA